MDLSDGYTWLKNVIYTEGFEPVTFHRKRQHVIHLAIGSRQPLTYATVTTFNLFCNDLDNPNDTEFQTRI